MTKILGFLYCGYGTVINLSREGHLENGGWGVGGVSELPKFILNIKVYKVVIKAATERSANYTFSDCLFLLIQIGAKFLAWTSTVLMVGKLAGRNEKCARRRIFTSLMAEWTSYASKLTQLQQAPV